MPKKETELKPEITKADITKKDIEKLPSIAKKIEDTTVTIQETEDSSDSYFRNLVDSLDDIEKISTNTEYLSVQENFTGIKLEFFSQFAYMPFLKKFVQIFETKRVSLNRKGRIEKIKALQERQQEVRNEKAKDFAKMFDMG